MYFEFQRGYTVLVIYEAGSSLLHTIFQIILLLENIQCFTTVLRSFAILKLLAHFIGYSFRKIRTLEEKQFSLELLYSLILKVN